VETFLVVSNIALWGAVIVQVVFILALFRYVGLLLNRIPRQGPPLGQGAPRREVLDIEGEKHVVGAPSHWHQVLIFTSPHCPWCEQMAPHLAPFRASLGPDYDLLLVLADQMSAGDARSYAQRVGGHATLKVAVASELFESYAIPGTPYGLLIDKEGIVRSKGTMNTLTDLQTLVRIQPQGH
jgi:methylamine dehydrogenase accessory protein MauD